MSTSSDRVPISYTNKPASTDDRPTVTLASSPDQSVAPTTAADQPPISQSFWSSWLAERPASSRYSRQWYIDQAIILTVFSVTGSLSLFVVKPIITQVFGVTGSMMDGPWAYRLLCVMLVMPAYSTLLVTIGTLAGRHVFFKRMALRTWGRLLPKKWIDKLQGVKPRSE